MKKLFYCMTLLLFSAVFSVNIFAEDPIFDLNEYTENINDSKIVCNCKYYGTQFIDTTYPHPKILYYNTVISADSDISGVIKIGAHSMTEHGSLVPQTCCTVREIARNAFSNCDNLKGVIIGGSSFENTKLLNNESDAVFNTVIDAGAFSNCSNLESVFIGGQEFYGSEGIHSGKLYCKTYNTEINWGSFYNCPNLKYIIIEDENAILDGLLYQTNAKNVTIYCKSGSTAETYASFCNIPYVLYDVEPTEEDLKTFNAVCYAYNYPELAAMLDYNENLLFANYRSEGKALGRNASTYNMVLGDADTDSSLTAADAADVLQKVLDSDYTMPVEELIDDYMSVIDADADGTLTAADAAEILQKVLDNDYKMPAEG